MSSSVLGTITRVRPVDTITEPKDTDVLFGRGGGGRYHPGTRAYRYLVKKNQPHYCTCSEREKRLISKSIVNTLRKRSRRFLSQSKDDSWFDIGDDKAIKKTSQALREGQPRRRQDLTVKYKIGTRVVRQPLRLSGIHPKTMCTAKISTNAVAPTRNGVNTPFVSTTCRHDSRCAKSDVDHRDSKTGAKDDIQAASSQFLLTATFSAKSHHSSTKKEQPSPNGITAQVPLIEMEKRPEALVVPSSPRVNSLKIHLENTIEAQVRNENKVLPFSRVDPTSNAFVEPTGSSDEDIDQPAVNDAAVEPSIVRSSSITNFETQDANDVSNAFLEIPEENGITDAVIQSPLMVSGLNLRLAPQNTDVLFGRGGGGQYHEGTQAYRHLVRQNQPQYCICTERQKRNIAKHIVESLRDQGRRFLARNKQGVWYDIGNEEAIKKTSQALREGQPNRRLSIVRSGVSASSNLNPDLPPPHPPEFLPTYKLNERSMTSQISAEQSLGQLSAKGEVFDLKPPLVPSHLTISTPSNRESDSTKTQKDHQFGIRVDENNKLQVQAPSCRQEDNEEGRKEGHLAPQPKGSKPVDEEDEGIAIQALTDMRETNAKSGLRLSSSPETITIKTLSNSPPDGSPSIIFPLNQSLGTTTDVASQYESETASSVAGNDEIIEPCDADILCYRGACIRNHPGTKEYRDLVRHQQPKYCICTEREKRNIAISIVDKLRNENRRFLAKGSNGLWYDIGDDKAVKKTSQALREGQSERRLLMTKARTSIIPLRTSASPTPQTCHLLEDNMTVASKHCHQNSHATCESSSEHYLSGLSDVQESVESQREVTTGSPSSVEQSNDGSHDIGINEDILTAIQALRGLECRHPDGKC